MIESVSEGRNLEFAQFVAHLKLKNFKNFNSDHFKHKMLNCTHLKLKMLKILYLKLFFINFTHLKLEIVVNLEL
jgi:hypothetical protein